MAEGDAEARLVSGDAALVVFLPDAARARLIGPVERWTRERTGCAPIARASVSIPEPVLRRFYPGVAEKVPDGWPVFARLFEAGPCLVTLWAGPAAAQRLPRVKGATHPAHCASTTIRGRFWCDNPTANLVHVSDDGDDALRELEVLRSLSPSLLRGPLSDAPIELHPVAEAPVPVHSAVWTLSSRVKTHLAHRGRDAPDLVLPDTGDARETMLRAEAWLSRVADDAASPLRDAIDGYLSGTASPSDLIDASRTTGPVDAWEALILSAGALTRGAWLEGRG
jgi:nucleoside diphosphate kinase